ncbi:hypothetical protein Tco_1081777 [Tanacetum coccineum]|uniref:Uncharacterized protein n=1 Tax=Tanacetum coccineum TaxID=301880 RepID=A0ABQ5I0M3_9ASTR
MQFTVVSTPPDGDSTTCGLLMDASKQGFGSVLMQRGKANEEADALSIKERTQSKTYVAMSITIHYGLKTKILEAQGEASKDLKAPAEWLRGLDKTL